MWRHTTGLPVRHEGPTSGVIALRPRPLRTPKARRSFGNNLLDDISTHSDIFAGSDPEYSRITPVLYASHHAIIVALPGQLCFAVSYLLPLLPDLDPFPKFIWRTGVCFFRISFLSLFLSFLISLFPWGHRRVRRHLVRWEVYVGSKEGWLGRYPRIIMIFDGRKGVVGEPLEREGLGYNRTVFKARRRRTGKWIKAFLIYPPPITGIHITSDPQSFPPSRSAVTWHMNA